MALCTSSAIVKLGKCRLSDKPAARNEDAVYFRERFLNAQIGESNSGDYAIETLMASIHRRLVYKFGLEIAPWQ